MAVLTSMAGWAAWSYFSLPKAMSIVIDSLVHSPVSSNSVSAIVRSTLRVVKLVPRQCLSLAWPGTATFFVVGAGFGYWMDGVESRQRDTVQRLQDRLIASREARAERHSLNEALAQKAYARLEQKTQRAAKE